MSAPGSITPNDTVAQSSAQETSEPEPPTTPTTPKSTSTSSSKSPRDPADKLAPQQEVPKDETSTTIPEDDVVDEIEAQEAGGEDGDEELGVPEDESPADDAVGVPAESSRRQEGLKVHWIKKKGRHHIVDMTEESADSPNASEEERQAHKVASRLVRKHTARRPPPPSSDSDSDHTNVPSSAVSLASESSSSDNDDDEGKRRHAPRQRRSSSRRSSASSAWSMDDSSDDASQVGSGGVLSALLSLYRNDGDERDKGTLHSLLRGRKDRGEGGRHGRTRRRWSSTALFAAHSRSSSFGGSRRSSFQAGDEEEEVVEEEEAKRVSRIRRHQQLPHRSQNLNEPYIPSARFSNQLTPSAKVTVVQQLRGFVTGKGSPATWFGFPKDSETPPDHGQIGGTNRSMAALITTTASLAAFASPTLTHVAPASGDKSETNDGMRKVSWYEGVGEGQARQDDRDRREEEEMGLPHGGDMEKAMEEGWLKGKHSRKKKRRGKRVQKELAVTKHVSNIIQRKKFIEMLAKAVVNYGAPAHSVEAWLSATADILQVEASFIFFPSVLIVAFRDSDVHSTDILFVRPTGGLELYRLSLVHDVYRKVVRDEISASQGCRVLRRIEKRTVPYSRVTLILAAAVASATSARVAFAGSFVDILMAGALGSLLAIVQFTVAQNNQLVSNIFEIGMAGILSFIARGVGASHYFCYQSMVSAAIVLILPGWHICLAALELGSKNVVAGAIRLVWAVVYTLFLSLGLGIGSEIFDSFGPDQLEPPTSTSSAATATVSGSFHGNNSMWDNTFNNGTFTFTNGSSTMESATTVACYRNPDWTMWWYTQVPDWWLFLLVPMFAFSLAVWFRADWRSKDMVVMVLVGCAGYTVNFFLTKQIDQSNVVSAVSAFTIGILGNLYSRIWGGSAFPSMVVGILLEVPNAIAAAGGLSASADTSSSNSASGSGSDTQQINTAVIVSIRMVQVGIGLAIGLFAAALVVYPFGKKGRYIFSY
ncbi:hypothetical protein CI109_100711 [Kwoniella shandongensis]|uniref:Uncharacterized protein n=1 Tax=Kwoniella shandongensis TaxID=1734106 RepID=A0A5M6C0L1_9TREE|nr:uncharacterized protein CI109_003368 [Kwoniella shandongensis]KAA5528080.1 hypothetical protein CI109_003368 [Kwoniella shandongensis]